MRIISLDISYNSRVVFISNQCYICIYSWFHIKIEEENHHLLNQYSCNNGCLDSFTCVRVLVLTTKRQAKTDFSFMVKDKQLLNVAQGNYWCCDTSYTFLFCCKTNEAQHIFCLMVPKKCMATRSLKINKPQFGKLLHTLTTSLWKTFLLSATSMTENYFFTPSCGIW